MERSMNKVSAILVLSMLVIAGGMGPMVAEARKCESPSKKFKGICTRESNCAAICKTEGFSDGDCKGLRRRCICTKQC